MAFMVNPVSPTVRFISADEGSAIALSNVGSRRRFAISQAPRASAVLALTDFHPDDKTEGMKNP
jgi:hypothetical protein